MILALLSQYVENFGRAGLLCLFFVLHLCVGFLLPYRRGMKPYFFMLMEKMGTEAERRLNRETRPSRVRFIRGVVVTSVLGVVGFLMGAAAWHAEKLPYGWAFTLAFLSLCVGVMALLKTVRQLIRHLQKNELKEMADVLQPYLEAPLDKADTHTLIRRSIEFIAVSLHRFLLAPVFWFLLAGSLGLSLYVTAAALYQAFGLADERRHSFGKVIRLVDALLNILPALLTAVMLTISMLFVSKSNPLRAVATGFRQAGRHRSVYFGGVMAVLAGGLGIVLGGPVRYSADYMEDHGWIGPEGASARLIPEDLARAAMLQYVFFICTIALVSVFVIM